MALPGYLASPRQPAPAAILPFDNGESVTSGRPLRCPGLLLYVPDASVAIKLLAARSDSQTVWTRRDDRAAGQLRFETAKHW